VSRFSRITLQITSSYDALVWFPESVAVRDWMKRRPAHEKIFAVLVEVLMAVTSSLNHR